MKELGLQELLRYALSGGVGIASLLLMYPNLAHLIGHIHNAGEVTLVLGAVLGLGTLVYNIHRALLYPPFFRWLGLITISQDSRWERFIQFCQFWWWWQNGAHTYILSTVQPGQQQRHFGLDVT